MSISIAQSRQQLSALIAAAQQQPQIITNRNTPVAVLVSAEYFARSEATVKPIEDSFYAQVQQLRETYPPQDDSGLVVPETDARQAAWRRANAFAGPVEAAPV
jgi:prevent-host-death family protein